ncbi:MAG TPA: HWE histidine kinase domain-containing protein, partial [Bordetella sp.]|nr:HWE histidine kinase domain-containing protein [Bordetella sp.]
APHVMDTERDIPPAAAPGASLSDLAVVPLPDLPAGIREFLYEDLLNSLPAAIYTTDAAGRLTFYNEAAVAFSGRRPTLGSDEWCVTWRLYHLDGRPMPHDQCPMAVALRENREVRGVEAIAERPDGSRIVFQPYPTPLRDADGNVVGGINMLVDVTERKQGEERQRLLLHEVNHRANNLLSVMQSFVTLTQAADVSSYRDVLDGRLRALAVAHSLLAESRWHGADLARLISEELAPYMEAGESGVWLQGSTIPLIPAAAQSLAMIIHELATNAVKYGALSVQGGKLNVQWHPEGNNVTLRWTEAGGPAVRQPTRTGLGSSVIERCAAQLGGSLSRQWPAEGLKVELCWPLQPSQPAPAG